MEKLRKLRTHGGQSPQNAGGGSYKCQPQNRLMTGLRRKTIEYASHVQSMCGHKRKARL